MSAGSIDQLTEAQRICLRLVLTHHSSKEIAAIVGVSPSAIDKRVERAVQMLGVGSRFEAARRLQEHEARNGHGHAPAYAFAEAYPSDGGEQSRIDPVADAPAHAAQVTYERLPSEPIDVPNTASDAAFPGSIEPWGLVHRFFGMSRDGETQGVARNRISRGDRVIRLIGLIGLIAITSMALVNMAMTLSSLLRSNREGTAPTHGAMSDAPRGRISMLKERRQAADKVTTDFLRAEAAVDAAAQLAASCVSTLLEQRAAANLPVGTGLVALQLVSEASLEIIKARQRFVDAHRALVEVRRDIGLGQFSLYGDVSECPPNEGTLRAEPMRLAAVA